MEQASFLEGFDIDNKSVQSAIKIFKDSYGSAMEPLKASTIINGENIKIDPRNQLIDNCEYNDPNFDIKQKWITKKLYPYQKKALFKLLEFESKGYFMCDDKKIVTNACLLKIACGSGKSLIFEILAMFYRDVPQHPIIISLDGQHIPEYEQMQFKYYPFYYEIPAYIEGEANCAITLKNYQVRKQTIILTHSHLLSQMRDYFQEDMPKAIKQTKIIYCRTFDQYETNADIVLIVANIENVNKLCALSYEKPFMRVIVDDYTSMTDLENFRQIRASSTIFVSGTGFLSRKPEEIPAGYYTLKLAPVEYISIVGNPEETWKGIVRNNIACINLLGSNNEFSSYEFIQKLEETSRGIWRCMPGQFYPILNDKPILKYSLAAMFVLLNKNRLIKAIQNIDRDYNISGNYPDGKWKDKQNEISYFVEWFKMLGQNNPFVKECLTNFKVSSGESSPIVIQRCFCCGTDTMVHGNYGCVATCCGAFFCSNCLKSMTTQRIRINEHAHGDSHEHAHVETAKVIVPDEHSYYCECCHQRNPTFFINITKKKDKNVFAISLIKEYFDCSDLQNHLAFDYYFKMFQDGLVPLYHEGKPINIQAVNPDGSFPCIYPREHLLIKAIANIQKVLEVEKIKIKPDIIPIILIYGSPKHMQTRITSYFRDLCKTNPSSPMNRIALLFKNDVGSLIGLQKSIIGIILFDTPKNVDELTQTNARLIRISPQYSNNDINFYIKASSLE